MFVTRVTIPLLRRRKLLRGRILQAFRSYGAKKTLHPLLGNSFLCKVAKSVERYCYNLGHETRCIHRRISRVRDLD